jgi:hypothetical protein
MTHDGAMGNLFDVDVGGDDETWRKEGTPFGESEKVFRGHFEKNRQTDEDYT